jgi:hypothetical protein
MRNDGGFRSRRLETLSILFERDIERFGNRRNGSETVA